MGRERIELAESFRFERGCWSSGSGCDEGGERKEGVEIRSWEEEVFVAMSFGGVEGGEFEMIGFLRRRQVEWRR